MDSRQKNKFAMDAAADNSSMESLSFAGFLSIQDQKAMKSSSTKNTGWTQKKDKTFEFTLPDSVPGDSKKISPADVLISNGKFLPQPLSLHSKQSREANQLRSHSIRTSTHGTEKRLRNTMKSDREVPPKTDQKKAIHEKNSWSGTKIFQSFMSPCRDCQAVKPVVKSTVA